VRQEFWSTQMTAPSLVTLWVHPIYWRQDRFSSFARRQPAQGAVRALRLTLRKPTIFAFRRWSSAGCHKEIWRSEQQPNEIPQV
jgi:hypothetical protein